MRISMYERLCVARIEGYGRSELKRSGKAPLEGFRKASANSIQSPRSRRRTKWPLFERPSACAENVREERLTEIYPGNCERDYVDFDERTDVPSSLKRL